MQFVQHLLRQLHFLNLQCPDRRGISVERTSELEIHDQIRHQRGFGLIEVIVVVAIILIVALGISTMMQDMFSQQQRAAQKGTLNSTRARLIEMLQSPTSWAATVAHTSNTSSLGCMRPGSVCTHNTTVSFNVIDSGGTSFYPSATATAGFRPDGTTCNSFSTATPDPSCPFRWAFEAVLTCPGAPSVTTCPSPDIRIQAPFQHAGGSAMGARFNPATYSIDFRRGADVVLNQAVTFRYRENDSSGEAGVCDTAEAVRALNDVVDANGIGASVVGGNTFRLPTGSYNCRVLAPGFKNGGNRIRVVRTAGNITEAESSVAVASVNTGGAVVNSVELVLRVNSATADFQVRHSCTSRPSASSWPSTNNNWSLGVPVPSSGGSYTNTTYTTVSCIRTGA